LLRLESVGIMQRKNRKWVAIGAGLYLFVMWSGYRWATHQGLPEGNIFVKIEREGGRRQNEARARAEAKEELPPTPTGEARLNAAAPAYVAARYDATHVVFIVTDETESRFASSHVGRAAHPTRVSASASPFAPLAGLQELWEPDEQAMHFFPEIVQKTKPGEPWVLSISSGSNIPVMIDRVVTAPMGCSLALGFLASVPEDSQKAFAASRQEYFVVRHGAVELAQPAVSGKLREAAWRASAESAKQIQLQLNARMKEELAKIDARLVANAASPGVTSLSIPVGDARPRLKEWMHADRALQHGDGVLEYDTRAFRLSPDGAVRLFVRARWTLAGATAFLMTAWFRVEAPSAPVLLWADASWAEALREGDAPVSVGDRLDFQSVLNEFDADQDGWAELLVHSYDARSADGEGTASIGLYLYTDKGFVPLKQALRRELRAPESCVDR
jgi:hypothetical protein